ncbi:MAG: hypothetical protein U0R50_06490 [Gaiellales bacterium]
MSALRAADPAVRLTPLGPTELAERRALVATPSRGTVPIPRSRRRSPATIAIAIVLAVGVTSGAIAAGLQPWERDPARQAGPGTSAGSASAVFQREYRSAQRALTLPPGGTWPRRSIEPNTIVATGRGGAGESTAVLVSMNQWSCYIVDRDAAGDRTGVRRGTAALTDLVDNHIRDVPAGTPEDGSAPAELPGPLAQFAAGDVPTQALYHGWIARALAGDTTQLAASCTANR